MVALPEIAANHHNMLKIEVQMLDGEALTLGSDALDSPGFNMLALFFNQEGIVRRDHRSNGEAVAEAARGAGSVSQL